MPQIPSLKRTLPARGKRARKTSDDRQPRQPERPAPWETALARVKRHIQTESRYRSHAD
jgi:hypothetical protein